MFIYYFVTKVTYMKKKKAVFKIQSEIRQKLSNELRKRGFIEISPVLLSSITDPLNHPTKPKNVKCYGKKYHLTQSMIFHKQIALKTLDKLFVFSPNIRIEPVKKRKTGRHLFEFTQLDLEIKNATREEVMNLGEELLISLIKHIKKNCKKELERIDRKIIVPKKPFKRISYKDAHKRYGEKIEKIISEQNSDPVWLTDIPLNCREFYDREHPDKSGYLKDMDLIYPEGYGEALSGGEREYKFEKIKKRIQRKGHDITKFDKYLKIAKRGLPPSAGFGIGIERLTRFICGLKRIEEASLFPKVPGDKSLI